MAFEYLIGTEATYRKHWVLGKHGRVVVAVMEVDQRLLSCRVCILRLTCTVRALGIYSSHLGCICCSSCIDE